jgi:hypothetical protein
MLIEQDTQAQFSDFAFSEFVFDKEHPLLKLSSAIHWENLLEYLKRFYSPDQGRPSISLRAQVGTLILKFLKNLSDRKVVEYVHESIYAQRFCGLLPSQVNGYMHPASGLSNFRAKIGTEGMAFIQEVLTCAAQKKSLKKGDKLILDTTCVPVDILYPTDIRLLERCRKEFIRLIQQAKQLGLKVLYRTYNRTARKVFVQFSKLSKPPAKTRKKVHKQLFQFVRRNLKQLTDLRAQATEIMGARCRLNAEFREFLQHLKNSEQKIRLILHQQKQIRLGKLQIPHRVVSFHQDHIRPIVRGKFPISTEFGPKVLVAYVKGTIHLTHCFANNIADATLIVPALRWFKTTFGRFPKEILGDRGFFSRMREQWLTRCGIVAGLQQRGKNPQTDSIHRRQIRQRLIIEAMISLGKRKFGWNKCRARIPSHQPAWIGLGAAALNAHRYFWVRAP